MTTVTLSRKQLEALLWRVTHANYRGKFQDGTKHVLHMSAKTYGTESWPLSSFSDAELVEKLGKRLDREIERLAAMKAARVSP